jgi:electron transfer flavoprotein beta subunit
MAAKKAEIPKWDAAALKADPLHVGLKGSPTIVARSYRPTVKTGGALIDGATSEEKARKLVDALRENKII